MSKIRYQIGDVFQHIQDKSYFVMIIDPRYVDWPGHTENDLLKTVVFFDGSLWDYTKFTELELYTYFVKVSK